MSRVSLPIILTMAGTSITTTGCWMVSPTGPSPSLTFPTLMSRSLKLCLSGPWPRPTRWATACSNPIPDRALWPVNNLIAGQSAGADNNPTDADTWGCDSEAGTTVTLIGPNGTSLPGPYPCFDYQTMADLLDAKSITWRYYAAAKGAKAGGYIWSAYDAIKHIRFGNDWSSNVISPPSTVLTDIQSRNLAQVAWVTPSRDYSDHAGAGLTSMGPDWIASITNT